MGQVANKVNSNFTLTQMEWIPQWVPSGKAWEGTLHGMHRSSHMSYGLIAFTSEDSAQVHEKLIETCKTWTLPGGRVAFLVPFLWTEDIKPTSKDLSRARVQFEILELQAPWHENSGAGGVNSAIQASGWLVKAGNVKLL